MKRALLNNSKGLLLLAVLAIGGCFPPSIPDTESVLFVNAFLIDGVSDKPVPNIAVLVKDGQIFAVGTTDTVARSSNTTVIDVQGATLLPGLINSHVHLTPNQDRDTALASMLRQGVTTVRDLGGNGHLLSTLAAPSTEWPTVVYTATFFGQGFMQDPRVARASAPFAPGEAPWMKLITAKTDIIKAVAAAREAGVTGLKLYASLDPEDLRLITSEAHAQGLRVWSHSVVFPAGPEHAVAAGVNELIHSKGLAALGEANVPDTYAQGIPQWMTQRPFAQLNPRSDMFKALFADMRDKKIALNPALVADGDVRMRSKPLPARVAVMRDWACAATGAAVEAGVKINAGTDYFGEPGLLLMEIERLTECGLTPMEAIKAATANGADAVGLAAILGTVEPGKVADLLVVRGSPASEISELRNTVLVMKSGHIVLNNLMGH